MMAEIILAFEGAAATSSQLCGYTPAGILLDFTQVFPSFCHGWIWCLIDLV